MDQEATQMTLTPHETVVEKPKLKIAIQGGNGRVGSTIAKLLTHLAPLRYEVLAADHIEPQNEQFFAVINAAPYFTSQQLAEKAVFNGAHYLDMTEDVEVTRGLQDLAERPRPLMEQAACGVAIIPQCGLAPGVISIIAGHMARQYEKLDTLKLRVGALPRHPNNRLGYALTWNIDGLINQYHGWADVIRNGQHCHVPALSDVEEMFFESGQFEAFTTAGGIGTLCDTFHDARTINYKTVRYPGHAELMRFLIEDMALDRIELKRILENALPVTDQDVVLISVASTGLDKGGNHRQLTYGKTIFGVPGRSALQTTTASATCAVLDLLAEKSIKTTGFVKQEDIPLEKFIVNRFGRAFS